MQVFTSDYFFKIIHLSLSTASLNTATDVCCALWAMATDVHSSTEAEGGEGAFNNEGPENLLPGSPWTEEWAASLAESELYAMTDDESRGTPS